MNFWEKAKMLEEAEKCGAHYKIIRRIKNNLTSSARKIDRIVKRVEKQAGKSKKQQNPKQTSTT